MTNEERIDKENEEYFEEYLEKKAKKRINDPYLFVPRREERNLRLNSMNCCLLNVNSK